MCKIGKNQCHLFYSHKTEKIHAVSGKFLVAAFFYCMGIYTIQYHRKTKENPLSHKLKSVPEHHVQERFFMPGFMCRMLSCRCLEAVTFPGNYLPTHTR